MRSANQPAASLHDPRQMERNIRAWFPSLLPSFLFLFHDALDRPQQVGAASRQDIGGKRTIINTAALPVCFGLKHCPSASGSEQNHLSDSPSSA